MSALLIFLLACCADSFAQGTTTVRGTVVDPQGAGVAGATITLSNPEKNFVRTQTTNEDGGYTFPLIPPGNYRLEAEAAGFKKAVITSVNALVDTPLDLPIKLEVGAITETVDVSASVESPINTTDATLGNAFESRRIEELPLNARNIVNLLSLQPGVTPQGEVNGGRRDQANITLDGVDANEQQTGLDVVNSSTTVTPGDAFASVIRVNPDSVQEFRVTTSVPTATQGRSSGAQVSLVTKSGTNEFHGSLYEFHRNTVTTANDFFNNAAGRFTADDPQVIAGTARVGEERLPRPKLLRNIFGGSLGGPILKDRFFFFYSYEGRRDASEQSVLRLVPSATLRQGIVRYRNVDGGITTLTPADIANLYPATEGVNPAGLAILQTAPLPNDFSVGDNGLNVAGFRFNAPISTKLDSHVARFDFTINERQSLFFRGNYQDDLFGDAPAFPNTPSPSLWVHPKAFAAGHTWSVTNTLVNNFRVGLTRLAFSQQGDSDAPSVSFRDVFTPFLYQRGLDRTTPVWNIVNDASWIKGTHTVQFGTNMRFIRNNRVSFQNSFDAALVNQAFYSSAGSSLRAPVSDSLDPDFEFDFGTAIAAALGRYSQYSVRSTFDASGQPLEAGAPSTRSFATEEYELYGQDSWKITPNLTLTYGLRWGVSTPVYERNGFQLVPTVNIGDFFEQRVRSAAAGTPYNELISFDKGGKANNGPGLYEMDWDNFAPTVAVAWSPDFGNNFFGRLFGRGGRSVIRGGFRMVYDRLGSQLAVSSESENSFGFSSETTNSSTSTNTTNLLGPRVTGLNPNVRTFPRISPPDALSFPLAFPADESTRILAGIDQSITTPRHYTWNASYGRELPKGLSVEFSYVGRRARNLLLGRDVTQLNNLADPKSGTDWYGAAGTLNNLRLAGASFESNVNIPYFENLFPNLGPNLYTFLIDNFGLDLPFVADLTPSQAALLLHSSDGLDITDYTFMQQILDDLGVHRNAFFHPQYASLIALSSVGRSDYHAGTFSIRQRFRNEVYFDFNYTLAKSMDNSSTLETLRLLSTNIRNPLNPDLEYSVSDFDIRHNINANFLVELPFGRGKRFFGNAGRVANALLGGWQLSGVMRYHTGLPAGSPSDNEWATNWQLTSNGVRLRDVRSGNCSNVNGSPNIFCNPDEAYRSFRNARAGEVGDRNITTLRLPSYFVLDSGLTKNFNMPWEGHRLQFRWEVFNVTNTQAFGLLSDLSLGREPFNATSAPGDFGTYIGSQTPVGESRPGRLMQFALRYTF
ncbi:MAG TPA: TonB-dependent receptor [Pyrinomonadaceae bacterium]|nr:TonB-dependent receptor [Pyrinomonadaceae bacterium]